MQTPFQIAQEQAKNGQLQTPSVSQGNQQIDYFGYQTSVHLFNLRIMASGLKCRGMKFTTLKKYYGLKGRTAADCIPQMLDIVNEYRASINLAPVKELPSDRKKAA